MAIGYDVEETERSYEQKGITGTVTRGAIEKCNFPCIILYSTTEEALPRYKLNVLSAMIKTGENIVIDKPIYLYLTNGAKVIKLGMVSDRQIKGIYDLFEGNKMDVYLNKDRMLNEEYRYILAE